MIPVFCVVKQMMGYISLVPIRAEEAGGTPAYTNEEWAQRLASLDEHVFVLWVSPHV